MTTERRGFGLLLLGVAALLVGLLCLRLRDDIDASAWASTVELVGFVLYAGGATAAVTGLVTAGLALVRRR